MNKALFRDPWVVTLLLGACLYVALSYWAEKARESRERLQHEVSQLDRSLRRLKAQGGTHSTPNGEDLYLSSLLYIDNDHWTVWFNERPVRVGEDYDLHEFTLISVTKDGVTLDYGGNTVVLKPHQTYRPDERCVLNGDKRRIEMTSD